MSEYSDEYDYDDVGFMHPLTRDVLMASILMSLVAFVGLVGHSLLFRALIMYKSTRTDFYILFGGLSLADSAFLAVAVPAHIMDMVEVELGHAWCQASHFLMAALSLTASVIVVALAVMRGLRLTNRNTLSQPRPRYLVLFLVAVYVVSFLACIPVTAIFTSFKGLLCMIDPMSDPIQDTWIINGVIFFIPLGLIIFTYILTHMYGKRYFSDSYAPLEKEKSRLVTAVVVAYVICQFPYRISTIVGRYSDHDAASFQRNRTMNNYLMCLIMADKAIRPVLYSKLASDLSEAFDEVINCTYCYKQYFVNRLVPSEREEAMPEDPFPVTTDYPGGDKSLQELTDTPVRTYDRTTSSSSSASASSQTPLVPPSSAEIV